MRPFRFGYQATGRGGEAIVDSARRAEDAGFDVFHIGDHVGEEPAALASLVAAALATTRIRICPLVLNNDLHQPVVLAQELATLDILSRGRLELGIGAGHSFTEYAAIGVPFDPPKVRKARLAESVEILRRLLDGETVTFVGDHYSILHAAVLRPLQARVPILVGVNGKSALAHAARYADTIGLTLFGRTLPDGQHHEVRWSPARLDDTIDWIREQSAHPSQVELHALVQGVIVTNDRRRVAKVLAEQVPGLSEDDALNTPFLAIGTHEQIVEHLQTCRDRWGISYFSVRDVDAFAPAMQTIRAMANDS